MCLGIPGKILSIDGDPSSCMGRVSFNGIECDVGLAFVPEAKIDDYVIVHVGYAIAILDETAAKRSLELLDELDDGLTVESREDSR